jgi:hypothetical protein
MRITILALILSISTVQAAKLDPEARMWKRAGFLNPEISSISVVEAPITDATVTIPVTHALDATIVMFRNTGWTLDQISAHLRRTNEIYAQCGIRLGDVKLVESDAYQGKLDINARWDYEGDDLVIAKATPIEKRPVIYLMRKIMAYEGGYTNFEDFEFSKQNPDVANTIFLANVINTEEYYFYHTADESGHEFYLRRDSSYNVVAHELAHLLADMGHETTLKEKNLLNGAASEVNDHILPRQCEKFKSNHLIRKL